MSVKWLLLSVLRNEITKAVSASRIFPMELIKVRQLVIRSYDVVINNLQNKLKKW